MLSLLNGKECLELALHTRVSLSLHRCVLKALTRASSGGTYHFTMYL